MTLQSFTVVLRVIPNQFGHPISTSAPCGQGERHLLNVLLHILGLLWKLRHIEGLI